MSTRDHRLLLRSAHRLLLPATCSCGWQPRLGEVIHRAFDKHLIEVSKEQS